jgi:trans-aconitate methyltransferase
MTIDERERVESISQWYLADQLEIDRMLIRYRYQSLKPFFLGSKALELGPAEGEMTRLLLQDFEHLTVVDGSSLLLQQIPDSPNLTKIHSLFETFEPKQRYHTVILEHILEHVEHPIQLLERAKIWGGGGSRILVGVPNANSIHRLVAEKMGLLQNRFALNERDIALGHRRVYSLDLLQEHILQAGLNIIALGGVFFKPLSNAQIQAYWTPEMIHGFYELGKDFPEYAAEIFVVCEVL